MARPVAVVTGASRGIGRAAGIFLARTHDLVLTGRSTNDRPDRRLPGTLEQTALACNEFGAHAIVVPADLAKDDDVDQIAKSTLRTFGRCDVLVNNAAISYNGAFLDVGVDRFRKSVGVDLLAPAALSGSFLPGMIERGGGVIVNISSSAAVDVGPSIGYAVAKAGLERFSVLLAGQTAGTGVHCVCVRIDELVGSEAVRMVLGDGYETIDPLLMATAIGWVIERGGEMNGRVVTIDDLRREGAFGS